jgi:hypothetical protein
MLTRQAFTFCKVETAIMEIRNKKATRNDVPGDILELLGKKWFQTNKATTNNIYETAQLLKDFSEVTITAVQKQKATKSGDNRTISHIAHTSNVVARILARSIEKKTKEYIQEDQFRFRREEGTIDTTGTLRTVSKELWTQIRNCVFASLTGRRMKRKFHMDKKVKISLDQGETKSVKIRTGVRQECCLAPILLDLQGKFVTNKALEGFAHFKIREQVIRTLKYIKLLCCSRKKRSYMA